MFETRPQPVPLDELLAAAGVEFARGSGVPVHGLEYDSRRVEPGFLFFAFAGAKADGRQFASAALEKGAVAVISETAKPEAFPGTWIQVFHGRRALAMMSRRFYTAAATIQITACTGTNGKTTTCCLIDTILQTAGFATALVGTIDYHVAGIKRKAVNTTPESLDLYRLYQELAARGGTHATMEVSSHALALGRVWGFQFHTAIYTNLTRDHLDFHSTMEDYFVSKCQLFAGQAAPPPKFAVINADDAWSPRIPIAASTEVIRYGLSKQAPLRAENIEAGFRGLRYDAVWEGGRCTVSSPLTGSINVYNTLAAFGAGLSYGLDPAVVARGIAARSAVAGRFERVDEGQPFLVAVDYAHTDDALRRTIQVARSLATGRVITLFGCGGDRDRAKRPLMGRAAGEDSDYVVLTSDNPRSEDPAAIIADALGGLEPTGRAHAVEADRERAIHAAIAEARSGDVVLLAGKGHEDYQVLKDRTIHFDDREIARAALREIGYRRGGDA
ncbi:MAG: UDP-N-acetylmuramoyl-L-alanyl-D-glutamate--2,6-diaminopimelate ligase [Bryobacteraceae bacterium]